MVINNRSGFTLIEVLATITLLSVVVGTAFLILNTGMLVSTDQDEATQERTDTRIASQEITEDIQGSRSIETDNGIYTLEKSAGDEITYSFHEAEQTVERNGSTWLQGVEHFALTESGGSAYTVELQWADVDRAAAGDGDWRFTAAPRIAGSMSGGTTPSEPENGDDDEDETGPCNLEDYEFDGIDEFCTFEEDQFLDEDQYTFPEGVIFEDSVSLENNPGASGGVNCNNGSSEPEGVCAEILGDSEFHDEINFARGGQIHILEGASALIRSDINFSGQANKNTNEFLITGDVTFNAINESNVINFDTSDLTASSTRDNLGDLFTIEGDATCENGTTVEIDDGTELSDIVEGTISGC
ncbi:prepilin-type N-terminal cleavage/methylation domain-containing protein [Salsuginibacillus halophilus]|uniref:Prepilin-type N-terminal cleavage/methylation domain-containing protein n=1 Tax=Salsuginibacillus halophilus TaxID=517424 RepID=A0A2P8HCN2_9BACI|nr:prepilin-type N-terminal cleavage/methylation domain-containing protein [Salsuginibacillus halophilus]PSL43987.1 prepilin-type N-terminal cleavage/methylation domain-containing protein [Salsuginibacillus halophilus]